MDNLIAIVGPTASGKTRRAVEVAQALDGEILSGDSRQVYVGMDLGTGKDLDEYGAIPYHLIDIRPAGYKYNLHEYLRDFDSAYESVCSRGKLPVLCGGTGLYVESALSGIRLPEVPANPALRAELEGKTLEELTGILSSMKSLHNTTDVDTTKRAIRAIEIEVYYKHHPDEFEASRRISAKPMRATVIGVEIDREERRKRISERLKTRLDSGMLNEVRNLLDSGIPAADLIYYGLEYKFLTLHITGALTEKEMFSGLETAIHQFAKRQMTWFRGMEKRGFKINWLPYDLSSEEFVNEVKKAVLQNS